jgi:uncharacterized protein YecE (DUF72 family)
VIRVGPAGWSYPDWDGRVYPRHKPPGFHPLQLLARTFDCIEIKHARKWVELVADHERFRFFAKLNRDFTHLPEPGRAGDDDDAWRARAQEFQAGLEPLVRAKRLSGLLVQFPVTFLFGRSEVRRLGRLRELFPSTRLVLEVRHESWFGRPALDSVRGLGYSIAYVDLPAAWNHPPAWHASTGPIGYLRLHGRNSTQWFRGDAERDDKYDYLYRESEIAELARKAERIAAEHDEAVVITNNHYSGQAVANAIDILYLLQRAPVPAPPEIVESFPHLRSKTRIDGQQPLF